MDWINSKRILKKENFKLWVREVGSLLPGFIQVSYWDPWLSTFSDSCIHSVGGWGQPSYYISHHQLEFLIRKHFTIPDIARLLCVSTSTITRRTRALGIGVRQTYSYLSDHRLDQLVHEVTTEFPSVGYRLIQSHFKASGYRITECRIRLSLRRVDRNAVTMRWITHNAIRRRSCHVAYPNALWHMDGNISLIWWGLVVHGAVDGYSRLIIYLNCSSNNRANTVYHLLVEAGERWGYPSRVRSDQGGENVDLARLMLMLRGLNRGSHITRRSVNNIWIERLWRDVFTQCLSMYYHLFYFLEDSGILNPDPPLTCMHCTMSAVYE